MSTTDRVADLMALLDGSARLPKTLPPLGHWLLFPPRVRQSAIGPDGHPIRDHQSLLPPIELPRRMWVSSAIDYFRPIPLEAPVQRRTTVTDVVGKQGRDGAMVFVTLLHEITHDGGLAIRERQAIVYRAAPSLLPKSPGASPPVPGGAAATRVSRYTADPVVLFRYSALTGNTHRIHYDRDYAKAEGYPGLVVHGPLAATLLLEQYRRAKRGASISAFAFCARAPVFDGAPFALSMEGPRLWIVDQGGIVAMTAEVRL